MGIELIICPLCNGEKVIKKDLTEIEIAMGSYPYQPCPECNGTGEVTLTKERIKKYNLKGGDRNEKYSR